MPDLLDKRERLTIERMFDAHNHRLALPAPDFSEIKSFRASYLHQITGIQTDVRCNRRQIDPQHLTIQFVKKSNMRVTVRQQADRNLSFRISGHIFNQCIIR